MLMVDEEKQELTFELALGEKGKDVSSFRVKMGEGVRMRAHVVNKSKDGVPMTLARVGLAGGLTFQTWQLKELKDKHDRMVVQVKGVLRSELSQSGIGTTVGRTRITIGADPRNPTQGAEQPLPVLEAKSFEATTVNCGK